MILKCSFNDFEHEVTKWEAVTSLRHAYAKRKKNETRNQRRNQNEKKIKKLACNKTHR